MFISLLTNFKTRKIMKKILIDYCLQYPFYFL